MHQPTSPKTQINRLIAAALRVRLVSDIPERLARSRIPYRLNDRRRERIAVVRSSGMLFIHVPKNAGTSVCEQLYGQQIKHETVQYYAKVAPDLLDLPSFAIMRDPIARFRSAFAYARSGGTRDRRVVPPFDALYGAFEGIDDAIDHLACARSPFDIDHIFRPQSWYLTDAEGACRIDRLVSYEALDQLGQIVGVDRLDDLPRLNGCSAAPPPLSPSQEAFVKDFYAADFALWRNACLTTSRISRPCSARRATF